MSGQRTAQQADQAMHIRRNDGTNGRGPLAAVVAALALAGALAACTPTVKVEAPEKPIVINLNVKIEHEVRVRVEKDVEQLLDKESKLF